MPDKNTLLRSLPKVDELLKLPEIDALARQTSRAQTVNAVRTVVERMRSDIRAESMGEIPDTAAICAQITEELRAGSQPGLRTVINATGIVLHTNLGRAPLAEEAANAVLDAARGYSNLEYDIDSGARGSRMSHVAKLLCQITGAQAAMAVNNNAAAVLLALTAVANGRQVIISRGELVEIGGAFRVPEVMEQSGCELIEVGTTNKTRASDYERAVCERTGAILKVHSSNFKLVGFSESAGLDELCALARSCSLPVIHDLGSGLLTGGEALGLESEPTVAQSVSSGADVITFSGDKLLGGPQAGIIIGKAEYIDKMRSHPLARALRIDKLTLAALEATLRLYLSGEQALARIPALAMLSADENALKARAHHLCERITALCGAQSGVRLAAVEGLAGGGSAPGEGLSSWAAAVAPEGVSVTALEEKLRRSSPHVVGRISRGELIFDVRTLLEGEDETVVRAFAAALGELKA